MEFRLASLFDAIKIIWFLFYKKKKKNNKNWLDKNTLKVLCFCIVLIDGIKETPSSPVSHKVTAFKVVPFSHLQNSS